MRERNVFIKSHITIFNVETIEPEDTFWKAYLSTLEHTNPLCPTKKEKNTSFR